MRRLAVRSVWIKVKISYSDYSRRRNNFSNDYQGFKRIPISWYTWTFLANLSTAMQTKTFTEGAQSYVHLFFFISALERLNVERFAYYADVKNYIKIICKYIVLYSSSSCVEWGVVLSLIPIISIVIVTGLLIYHTVESRTSFRVSFLSRNTIIL